LKGKCKDKPLNKEIMTSKIKPEDFISSSTYEYCNELEKDKSYLLKELQHLVRLLEPLEKDGGLDIPGLATLNGARAAIKKATE
jgi:hypothetical protein